MPSQQDINENAIRNPQRFQMVFSKAGAKLYFARLCCMHTHIIYIYIYIVFICFFFKFHASMESIKMVNMFVDLGFLFSAVEQCYQLQGLWLFSL